MLRLVDHFTQATCITKPASSTKIEHPFSCAVQSEKERCDSLGGLCNVERDGYYMVNVMCVAFGLVTFFMYIRPRVMMLQSLPLRAWRLAPSKATSQ